MSIVSASRLFRQPPSVTPTPTLPRQGAGGGSHWKICGVSHLVVMTGLVPVIHGNVAAGEDVDGRIKSGHGERRGTCANAIALRRGGGGAVGPPVIPSALPGEGDGTVPSTTISPASVDRHPGESRDPFGRIALLGSRAEEPGYGSRLSPGCRMRKGPFFLGPP